MPTKRSEIIFSLLAIPIDLLMVFLAFLFAYWLRSQTEITQVVYLWPLENYLALVAFMLPFWVLIFASAGLYAGDASRRPWGGFTKIFLAVSAGIMLFVAWIFLSRTIFFSRLIVIYAWIAAILLVSFGRFLMAESRRLLYRNGYALRRVIIIGQTETAETLKRELELNKNLGYEVVNGLVEPDVGRIKAFLTRYGKIDEMIVTDSELSAKTILELIALSEEYSIAFRLVPNMFEVKSTNVTVQTLAAIPVIEYHRTPLDGWAGLVKRVFDVIVSSLALIVLSPVFLIIILFIKLDSRGPVYYRHKRLGWRKRPFYLYKFRTLKAEYCTGDDYLGRTNKEIFEDQLKRPELSKEFAKSFKLKDDPRVTKIGQFLRKTSIDELPQLFNVLFGHLSLVGPRPIVEEELAKYGDYKHRLFIIKPGATGLWQVSGRSDMPYSERVKLDMYYIENWSLWSDFIILVKTGFVMLFRKNAY